MSIAYENRKHYILKKLQQRKEVKVSDMSKKLKVSMETIRRDLDKLDKEGKLKKVYGGATVIDSYWEPSFTKKININVEVKNKICQVAASLVNDNDIVMLGSGTTVLNMIDFLSDKRNLTIITNSIPVIFKIGKLKDAINEVIFIGGQFDFNQQSTYGSLAELTLRKIRANKAFISAGGVTIENGITDYDLDESYMSQLLLNRSDQVYLLSDHTKIDRNVFSNVCPIGKLTALITDKRCPLKIENEFKKSNVKIFTPDEY